MDPGRELLAIRAQVVSVLDRLDRLIWESQGHSLSDTEHVKSLERTKAIEWVLRQSGGPMRPVQIWAELQSLGRDDSKMEVQVTTHDLWQRGRIDRVGRGLYASKSEA
jgi:hypothetical protein